jgi:hypothetical protein
MHVFTYTHGSEGVAKYYFYQVLKPYFRFSNALGHCCAVRIQSTIEGFALGSHQVIISFGPKLRTYVLDSKNNQDHPSTCTVATTVTKRLPLHLLHSCCYTYIVIVR